MAHRFRALVLVVALTLGVLVLAAPAQADRGKQRLTVATYNLYLGANLTSIFAAPDLPEVIRQAGIIYAHMVEVDFPSRADAIARLLKRDRPDVIGLQEVALWKKGPLGGELVTTFDFLEITLKHLHRHGLHYRAVATNVNFSGQLPISGTEEASFTDHDVILVRQGGRVRATNPVARTFGARLTIPTPSGLTFTVPRGWSTVDVTAQRRTTRVANTHLEAFGPAAIRNAQGHELHADLAQSPYPVVALGDFNSLPSDATGPYGHFTTGGYADGWVAVHGPEGGFTAGQTDDLDNVPSKLDHRVDYVFYQPDRLGAVRAEVIGDELGDRTAAGLWPSDHAGVVVRLHVR